MQASFRSLENVDLKNLNGSQSIIIKTEDPKDEVRSAQNLRSAALETPTEALPPKMSYKLKNGKYVKVWKCGVCDKEFAHKYMVARHQPTHTGDRKFGCDICRKAFKQKSTLAQHKVIHSPERPYECSTCNKTFNRASSMISHRKIHCPIKPHLCHVCNKGFHQKGNLKHHIYTHTNERPYKCDKCSKGFNQRSNLMCHKVKKPPILKCRCGEEFLKRMDLRRHVDQLLGKKKNGKNICGYINEATAKPIKTEAMGVATVTQQTPLAGPSHWTCAPALVPAVPLDLKKHCNIFIARGIYDSGETKEIEMPIDYFNSSNIEIVFLDENGNLINEGVRVVPKVEPVSPRGCQN